MVRRDEQHSGTGWTSFPYYINVPTVAVGAGTTRLFNLGMNVQLNLTFVESSGTNNATLIVTDHQGFTKNYSLAAGASAIIKRCVIRALDVQGSGAIVTGVGAWPDEIDPRSIAISGVSSINVSQIGGAVVPNEGGGMPIGISGAVIDPRQVTQVWSLGRVPITFLIDRAAGITTEAVSPFTVNKGSPPTPTTNQSAYTVTAGKKLKLQALTVSVLASSTTELFGRVRVRSDATAILTSPIIIDMDIGGMTGTYTAGTGFTQSIDIPDGIEVASNIQITLTQIMNSTSSTVTVSLVGFEY